MSDRYPFRTGGPYSPPASQGFGITVDQLRESTVREFGRLADYTRAFPAISVNTIPCLWVNGVSLCLNTATIAPAATVRGEFPAALYGRDAAREGSVSIRVMVPGFYQLRMPWTQAAPGGGTIRWYGRVNIIGSEASAVSEPGCGAVGASRSVTVAGPTTNATRWTPLAEMFIPERALVGLTISRDPTLAPDTATADAYVLGLSLERTKDNG